MAATKEIEIIINGDGTIEVDQLGWEGKSCDGAVDDLIKLLGKEVKTNRKKEWYKRQRVRLNQRHTD